MNNSEDCQRACQNCIHYRGGIKCNVYGLLNEQSGKTPETSAEKCHYFYSKEN